MRKTSYDILLSLRNNSEPKSQRALARENSISLGLANKCIKELIDNKMIDENNVLLDNACKLLETNKPQSAVILAAGYGARMVPINNDSPKGLLVVNGEKIIERIIKQLHEVNVNDISIVVGYQKEKFEYLIDEYNVKLIVNNEYKLKNNLHYYLRLSISLIIVISFLMISGAGIIRLKRMRSIPGIWLLTNRLRTVMCM